jgi:aspartate kinase
VDASEALAVVAVVGEGLPARPQTAARAFSALADRRIEIWLAESGTSGLSLTVAVREQDFAGALQALYDCFAGERE